MNSATTALRDKLANDLQTCEGLISSLRSRTMEHTKLMASAFGNIRPSGG